MSPPRLVLDTNIVLDLLHYTQNEAQPLLPALLAGDCIALADERTLDELERVVTYAQFGMDTATGQALVARYRQHIELIAAGDAPPLPRCKDRDDQKFLELAARGGADLLVSKDKALLKLRGRRTLGFAIYPPAEAVVWLATRIGA